MAGKNCRLDTWLAPLAKLASHPGSNAPKLRFFIASGPILVIPAFAGMTNEGFWR